MAVLKQEEDPAPVSGDGPGDGGGVPGAGAPPDQAPAEAPVAANAKRTPRAPVVRACGDCQYWATPSLGRGAPPKEAACRRHPPMPGSPWAQWPMTKPSDWCGDFEAR